ncbi:MAG: DNA repair protein RadA [Tissierellia bacterium]|nr:DNA repair protein RadA [Tissierellia bacterium]
MAKKSAYICNNCGYSSTGYYGKCPACGEWDTFIEEITVKKANKTIANRVPNSVKLLSDVKTGTNDRIISGIDEFDRVMGGGIVNDSVTIVTAKPGAGKSTLLLQISAILAKKGYIVLYSTGEESESQIKDRAKRLQIENLENLWILSTNFIQELNNSIESVEPDIIIVDSIQTISSTELSQRPGSPTQTMECANALVNIAKYGNKKRAVFIVGQMTKADELAGVRTLEHLVDCVLKIEAETQDQLRILTSTKNRYGSTGESGFFEMTYRGLKSIDNPSEFFTTKREDKTQTIGSALCMVHEGTRNIVVEVESLVSRSFTPYPKRITESTNKYRFDTLVAIVEERGNINLYDKNVIIKATGGIKLEDTSSSLAIIMSIVSSALNLAIDPNYIFIGDVGLTGEIKKTPNIETMLKEAKRLGYKKVFISSEFEIEENQSSIEIIKLRYISELIKYLRLNS